MKLLKKTIFCIYLSFCVCFLVTNVVLADTTSGDSGSNNNSSSVLGYKLAKVAEDSSSAKAGLYLNCYNADINGKRGGGDQSLCKKYYSGKGEPICREIPSVSETGNDPVYACMTSDMVFCHRDSDCLNSNGQTCIIGVNGNLQKFSTQFDTDSEVDSSEFYGICSATGGSADKNSITITLCRIINVITGGAGKAVCVIVVSAVGVMFFLGKVQWSLLLSVGGGVAFIFGAKTIIGVITGGDFTC